MEDNLKKNKKKYGRRPGKKLEDDLKTNEKIENDHTYNLKKSTLIGCDIIVN